MSTQPLELRTLRRQSSNGVQPDVPALHRLWMDSARHWVTFMPPPIDETIGAEDVWCERATFVSEDLAFLLSLEHHRFWSQMVHDQLVHKLLETTLQELPRPHDLTFAGQTKSAKVRGLLEEIMRQLFLVFVRLSTFKETKSDFISPGFFGKLIYDHFLLDIPRIMDLCVLFRSCSSKIVERMVANIFKLQPAYVKDLASSIESVSATMTSISDRVDIMTQLSNCDSSDQVKELKDLVSYVTDITLSIEAFLQTYPPSANVFRKQSFEMRLAVFYQNVIVAMSRYVIKQKEVNLLQQAMFGLLVSRLMLARKASVAILRLILHYCCLKSVVEGTAKESDYDLAETFIEVATNCLSEGALIVDYSKLHPLQDDFDIFAQAGIAMDSTRIQYLLDGIHSLDGEMQTDVLRVETKRFNLEEQAKQIQGMRGKEDGAAVVEPSGVPEKVIGGTELASLITQVKDLLPDLGDGFVDACLQYFDHSAEKVINSIFEDNLPPHLTDMPRNTPRKESEVNTLASGLLRHNVYNDDEFDVNTKDSVDPARVHRGKRKVAKNANVLLDDKRELAGMKERFSALGIVADEVIMTPGSYDADYDDEYDDTYDENAIGQGEPDAKDEMLERRPFVLPRALGGGHVGKTVYMNEDDEEDEDDESSKKDAFVRNPADVRAEAEQRRQTKLAQRGGGRRTAAAAGPPDRDVVGRTKGQGQEKSVLINRARKNANKGKQHRAMAERKQGRGMF